MKHPLLALSGLLLFSALPGRAQTAPEPATSPRFFVGLGAYSSYYQKVGTYPPQYVSSQFRLPVQLTAGYQFTPRLAVQASAAYSGTSRDYFISNYNNPTSPTGYSEGSFTFTSRSISAAVLARYTVTNPTARLRVDALGGAGLEHSGDNSRGTVSTQPFGQDARPVNTHYSKNILTATLGAGLRYRLSPHFELAYDFTVNRALASDSREYLNRSLTTAHGLGVRYRFGSR
ncbi:outer membrane beta-barrel protein [Hymenobacter monticola]|uniref:Porin family protein n=1 Tax=Hymenobacter monticola TaxID=1705399 RepID=A0ABY4B3H1_9BACT|nr:outer membrane beta-barrel protein [Hymenobacter monticola]UOE33683.1 porin family protein [Hymenobacter monticola]